MPRISLQPQDLSEPAELLAAIRARRGGRLINLDRMLLHSPALTEGWNGFLGTVRGGLSLAPGLRELAICVVAVVNGAEYEFHHHAPEMRRAGASEAQIEALRQPEKAASDEALFSKEERAIIRLAIEMTRHVTVSDAAFDAARAELGSDRLMVEAVGVIACYNMVSRFLVALDVRPETHGD